MDYINNDNPINDPEPEPIECRAIWLNQPVQMPDGTKTVRVSIGDEIIVVDGVIVDAKESVISETGFDEATHKVIDCYAYPSGKAYSMTVQRFFNEDGFNRFEKISEILF